jgi:hypothetical protein
MGSLLWPSGHQTSKHADAKNTSSAGSAEVNILEEHHYIQPTTRVCGAKTKGIGQLSVPTPTSPAEVSVTSLQDTHNIVTLARWTEQDVPQ